ncbi:MAG: redox-regulated ATPase YchF [bacterium]
MSFSCGIVGLPNVGKSTIFSALSSAEAEAANYPFCTIDPNVGVVKVPDRRLEKLAELYKSARIIPTTIEFVDIAGLVRGASRGEGLGNKFLGNIREVDAVVQVVRCFQDGDVAHVEGKTDPAGDVDIIRTELLLADLETVERRMEKTRKTAKSGNREAAALMETLLQLQAGLSDGKMAVYQDLNRERISDLHLLTDKPVLYVGNLSDKDSPVEREYLKALKAYTEPDGSPVIEIAGKIEAELTELDPADRAAFKEDLGISESGLERMITAGYRLLDLITFYTCGPKEAHAWTITRNTRAPQAAGVIHTDFERGFIRAEISKSRDLLELGSEAAVKEKGLLKQEGKDYLMCDGDIAHFKFNV